MKQKKLLAVLLAGSMCLSMLAGCSNSNSPSNEEGADAEQDGANEGGSGTEGEADYSENLPISVWVHTDDNESGHLSETNENPVIAYISEKFNVKFEWQIPPTGSESEQMNLMIGSGDYTDVFDTTYSQQTCGELYEDGIIQDLTPYVEKYMPNYLTYIDGSDIARKSAYTDDGKIIYIPNVPNEPILSWGGMMYNRQILEDMTDGNVQFPSGGEEPATVEDWEYMLELMKQHYEASGLTDYACLILPANGYFASGDVVRGFGGAGSYYIDDDGKVQHGVLTEGFYNYLVKMKEWYAKGYIYQDFASRSSDPFYFPNTALTYSGSAGVFYGMIGQHLGGLMSMPDQGLIMDFRALTAPLDTENNATPILQNGIVAQNQAVDAFSKGWVVSTACDEAKLIRWLQICDYLFSEEGSMMKTYGLTKEQAGDNAVYERLGLEDGTYWFDENGEFTFNPICNPFIAESTVEYHHLAIQRWPGLTYWTYYNQKTSEEARESDRVWVTEGFSASIPVGLTMSVEESNDYAPLNTACEDYIKSMVPKYIMGTEALTEDSFEAFVEQIRSLGMDKCIEIYQTAYDRYMAK